MAPVLEQTCARTGRKFILLDLADETVAGNWSPFNGGSAADRRARFNNTMDLDDRGTDADHYKARLDRAADLQAAADAREGLTHARQEIGRLQAAGAATARRLVMIDGEIEALHQQLDDAGRIPPDASDPPWRIGPGAAGRVGLYDAEGHFIGEVQNPVDARLIVTFINRAARQVTIEAVAAD